MKKIVIVLIIILLSFIIYFQYKSYKKYHPPTSYNYAINDSIDVSYYDPLIVQQYFENAYQLESFARQLWFNKGIDINFPDEEKDESGNALDYFRVLTAKTNILESKLIRSYKLKTLGFTNDEIKSMEKGISPEKMRYQQAVTSALQLDQLKIGDVGQEVWVLQNILIKKGYDIPKEGNFGSETLSAIKDFQEKKDLYPSGAINIATIKELIK